MVDLRVLSKHRFRTLVGCNGRHMGKREEGHKKYGEVFWSIPSFRDTHCVEWDKQCLGSILERKNKVAVMKMEMKTEMGMGVRNGRVQRW